MLRHLYLFQTKWQLFLTLVEMGYGSLISIASSYGRPLSVIYIPQPDWPIRLRGSDDITMSIIIDCKLTDWVGNSQKLLENKIKWISGCGLCAPHPYDHYHKLWAWTFNLQTGVFLACLHAYLHVYCINVLDFPHSHNTQNIIVTRIYPLFRNIHFLTAHIVPKLVMATYLVLGI